MEVVLGALPSLLPKLAELQGDKYKLQKEVKGGIRFLKSELESMQAAMQAALEKISETQVDELDKIWARDVRELSYDIEDKIDIFMVEVLSSEPAKQQGFRKFIDKTNRSLKQPKSRHKIAVDIRDIKCRVEEVAKRRDRYEVAKRRDRYRVDSVVDKPIAVDPRLPALYKNATGLVGIDHEIDEVTQFLMRGKDESKKQCNIVSIFGFSGIGKTALANAVYQNLRAQFDCCAFVSVSRTPDIMKLFRAMLLQLSENINEEASDATLLIYLLRDFLQNRRYFIIIDDIWNIDVWQMIKCALPDDNDGYRIITTTRKYEVAINIGGAYNMKPLSFENSRILFHTRVFGNRDEFKCPDELAEVSERILKKCCGVPLAIIMIANFLVCKPTDKFEWCNVCNSIGTGLEENSLYDSVRLILSPSYDDLPHHLRTCLLYLSVYPEDHLIQKNKLIWSWIAQGFVCLEEGVGLFELGERYFYELINRSMILPIEIEGIGLIYGCRVHDMVLDFIRWKSHEENFVSVWDEACSRSVRVRRLALQNRTEGNIFEADIFPAPLRSINAIGCPMYIIPPLESFVVLRVLDLECCRSMEGYSLKHLGKLGLLRYIGLRNTLTSELPEEIGHLKYLQTLELEGSGVEELPGSMGQLTELRCLNADWKTRVPEWIGKLTSLQQLEMYPGGGNDENSARLFIKELRNLTELRVLRFVIEVQDEEQMRDLLESLSNLRKIEVIHFHYYGVQLNSSVVSKQPTCFVRSQHLCSLEFHWLEFSRLPVWINTHDLPKLCHLWLMLSDVDEQDLGILGKFPKLRCLHLVIVNTEQGEIITSGGDGAFQSLKFCSITKPLKFRYGAMPRLEVLDFHFNMRLLRDANHDFDLDFGLGNLPSLQKVIVQINGQADLPAEVLKVEADLRSTVNKHPRRPTLEFT